MFEISLDDVFQRNLPDQSFDHSPAEHEVQIRIEEHLEVQQISDVFVVEKYPPLDNNQIARLLVLRFQKPFGGEDVVDGGVEGMSLLQALDGMLEQVPVNCIIAVEVVVLHILLSVFWVLDVDFLQEVLLLQHADIDRLLLELVFQPLGDEGLSGTKPSADSDHNRD